MQLSARIWSFHSRLDDILGLMLSLEHEIYKCNRSVLLFERLIIQLQTEWDLFVRSTILDSATGRYENSKGLVVSGIVPPRVSREAAAFVLLTQYPRRKYEPDWYLPTEAIDAAMKLKISNATEISMFLGSTPWLIEELRHFRNFISHRSKRSALTLRSVVPLRSINGTHLCAHCLSYNTNGLRRIEDWVQFMKNISIGMTR